MIPSGPEAARVVRGVYIPFPKDFTMRPLKFVFMLLFGAAVLITFLKLLFFALFLAVFGGAAYLMFRLFGGARRMRRYRNQYARYRDFYDAEPLRPQAGVYAEPIRPRYRPPFSDNPFARNIEVQ